MRKNSGYTTIVYLLILVFLYHPISIYAEPSLEETHKLLQKSLTIFEIDQELSRLTAQEDDIAKQISLTEQNIEQKNQLVQETRQHAGKVLRSYYMGERYSIWIMILSAKSFSQALTIFEYFNRIIDNDHRLLHNYLLSSQELQNLQQQLNHTQTLLKKLKAQFVEQRKMLVDLQKEVDEQLAKHPEAEKLTQQINTFTANWEKQGIPLFRTYFKALNEATLQLPELFANKDNLIVQGFNYTFQITDKQLNQFLRSKNPIFINFSFSFMDDQVVARGKKDDVDVSIKGHYIVEEQPVNAIRFVIDELIYNAFTLPSTTANSLEKEFELVLYPQNFASFFYATGVQIEKEKLAVLMKVNLNNTKSN